MKENKKSGGGDVRAGALSQAAIGIKPKTRFRLFPNLALGGLLRTPLTSLAARRKSRFAEKKSASPKKNCACGCWRGVAWVGALEGRAQNIAPLQVGGIDAIDDMGVWGCGLGGMKEIKKSGGGDVRAKALSRAAIGIKPKTRFRFFPNLAHGGSLRSPLTSLAARKKSRFAEKKSASPKKNCACGGWRGRLGGCTLRGGRKILRPYI